MAFFKFLSVTAIVAFSIVATAKPELTSTQRMAAEYLLRQIENVEISPMSHNDCHEPPDVPGACVTFVAGNYPSSDERLRAARACAGNHGDGCVKFVAGNYPSFTEREEAAQSCKYNFNEECAQFVAGNYPSMTERKTAAQACLGADVGCVKQVAGNYPSFTERVNAAKACGGH